MSYFDILETSYSSPFVPKVPRKYLTFILVLLVAGFSAWIAWAWPRPANVSLYVPANAAGYIEINSVPRLVDALGNSNAWSSLTGSTPTHPSGFFHSLSSVLAGVGAAPARLVLYEHCQAAVAVFGLDTAGESDVLKVKPKAVLILETHMTAFRARHTIEELSGDMARRAYGTVSPQRKDQEEFSWVEWRSQDGSKEIIAAVVGSVGFIGNDETAVRSCLAVQIAGAPHILSHDRAAELRQRLNSSDSLAFGYLSREGSTQLLQLVAALYSSGLSEEPAVQSAAASLIPRLSSGLSGELGWTAHSNKGRLVDSYLFLPTRMLSPEQVTAFAPEPGLSNEMLKFVPGASKSFTYYNIERPDRAWQSLRTALGSRLDATTALIADHLLEMSLEPYLIKNPYEFLSDLGENFVTVRGTNSAEGSVAIFRAKEGEDAADILKKTGVSFTKVAGETDLYVASKNRERAAAVVSPFLILGSRDDVKQALLAVRSGQNVLNLEPVGRTLTEESALPFSALSIADEGESAAAFARLFKRLNGSSVGELRVPQHVLFSTSRTLVTQDGIERQTSSSFGQLGAMAVQFAGSF
jgi:hypothetical protein